MEIKHTMTYLQSVIIATAIIAPFFPSIAQAGNFIDNLPRCEFSVGGNNQSLTMPVARTKEERGQGLSGVKDIASGMIFVWRWPQRPVVWMKGTLQPLDIAFIDEGGVITEILTLEAGSIRPHRSESVIVAMIELPAGELQRIGAQAGDTTTANQCRDKYYAN